MCALQEHAQRAMVAYMRSVHLQPNRKVFNVSAMPVEEFALSIGLSTVPRLRFLARKGASKSTQAVTVAEDGSAKVEQLCHACKRDVNVFEWGLPG